MARDIKSDSFYITCTSNKCLEYYPENKTSSFTTRLRESLVLNNSDRKWEVGVSSFTYSQAINNFGPCMLMEFYIFDGVQIHKIPLTDQHVSSAEEIAEALQDAVDNYAEKWTYYELTEGELSLWEAQKKQNEENDEILSKRSRRSAEDETTFERNIERQTEEKFIKCIKSLLIAALTGKAINFGSLKPNLKYLIQYHAYICAYTHYKVDEIWAKQYEIITQIYTGRKLEKYKNRSIYKVMERLNKRLFQVIDLCRIYYEYYIYKLEKGESMQIKMEVVRSRMSKLHKVIREIDWAKLGNEYSGSLDTALGIAWKEVLGMDMYNLVINKFIYEVRDEIKMKEFDDEYRKIEKWAGILKELMSKEKLNFFFEYLPYILFTDVIGNLYKQSISGNEKYVSISSRESTVEDMVLRKVEKPDDVYDELKSNIQNSVDRTYELILGEQKLIDKEKKLDWSRFESVRNVKRQWKENIINWNVGADRDLLVWGIKHFWHKGDMDRVKILMKGEEEWLMKDPEIMELMSVKEAEISTVEDKELSKEDEIAEISTAEELSKQDKSVIPSESEKMSTVPEDKSLKQDELLVRVITTPSIFVAEDKPEEKADKLFDESKKAVESSIAVVAEKSEPKELDILSQVAEEKSAAEKSEPIPKELVILSQVVDEPLEILSQVGEDSTVLIWDGSRTVINPQIYGLEQKKDRKRKNYSVPFFHNVVTITAVDDMYISINFALQQFDFAMSPTLLKATGFMDFPYYMFESMQERIRLKRWLELTENVASIQKLYNVHTEMEKMGLNEFFSSTNKQKRNKLYKNQGFNGVYFEFMLRDNLSRKNITFEEYVLRQLLPKEEYFKLRTILDSEEIALFDIVMYRLLKESPFTSVIGTDNVNFTPSDLVFIYCNIIEPEYVDNTRLRLLEILSIRSVGDAKLDQIEFSNTHYKTVDVEILSDMEFFIATSLGEPVPFRYGPATIQLHFRRKK